MRDAVILDVDGTLCDVRSIRHYVDGGADGRARRDFNRFHSESIHCPPFKDVVALARRAKALGLAVLVVTGREDRWSFLTSAWLGEQGVDYDELMMRPSKDYRADEVIKSEILREILAAYRPILAVDDRTDIADIWRTAGIPTVLVDAEGSLGALAGPSLSAQAGVIDALLRPRQPQAVAQ